MDVTFEALLTFLGLSFLVTSITWLERADWLFQISTGWSQPYRDLTLVLVLLIVLGVKTRVDSGK